jgi:hypothetical protein
MMPSQHASVQACDNFTGIHQMERERCQQVRRLDYPVAYYVVFLHLTPRGLTFTGCKGGA